MADTEVIKDIIAQAAVEASKATVLVISREGRRKVSIMNGRVY